MKCGFSSKSCPYRLSSICTYMESCEHQQDEISFDRIARTLANSDAFAASADVCLETKVSIPMFSGRPKRSTRICKEDEVNLKIALETAKSWEEFISLV